MLHLVKEANFTYREIKPILPIQKEKRLPKPSYKVELTMKIQGFAGTRKIMIVEFARCYTKKENGWDARAGEICFRQVVRIGHHLQRCGLNHMPSRLSVHAFAVAAQEPLLDDKATSYAGCFYQLIDLHSRLDTSSQRNPLLPDLLVYAEH